jgi:CubicO group peptidase (beta-lactamase class C family)
LNKNKKIFLFLFVALIVISCNKDKNPVSPPSTEILDELVSQIENNRYGEVHSLLIVKDDSIIFEKYFNGYTRERKHALYSVTKSFTSALIGICLSKGYINNIDMNVLEFFPEYKNSIAHYDSLKEQITIRHLLTMTAGFTWDEWTTPYSDPNNDVVKLVQSNDWIKSILDLPMSHVPGTNPTYNSGISHVLSGIIKKVTGQSARDFARDNLFTYLDIDDWSWENRPDGISIGGWGLSLRPIDMVKLGRLYLKKGRWDNIQVIPESWIEESIEPHCRINYWCDYGYQWWRYGQPMVDAGTLESTGIFFAAGRGEQFIWVIPDRNAVVVCTGWNDNQTLLEPVLWEYVLRALDN